MVLDCLLIVQGLALSPEIARPDLYVAKDVYGAGHAQGIPWYCARGSAILE